MEKKIIKVKLDDLKSYGGNPRHNNKSAHQVAKSIELYGYINPIVVDENNVPVGVIHVHDLLVQLKFLQHR